MKETNFFCDECNKENLPLWNIGINFKGRAKYDRQFCKECLSKILKLNINELAFYEKLISFKLKNDLSNWAKWSDIQIATFVDILEQNKIPLDIKISIWCEDKSEPTYLFNLVKGITPMKDIEEDVIDERRKKNIDLILKNRLKKGSVKVGRQYIPKEKVDKALKNIGVE